MLVLPEHGTWMDRINRMEIQYVLPNPPQVFILSILFIHVNFSGA